MRQTSKPKGLLLSSVDVETGNWTSPTATLSGEANQLIYNLLRANIQTGSSFTSSLSQNYINLFTDYVQKMLANGLIGHSKANSSSKVEYTFAGDYNVASEEHSNMMLSSACNLGEINSVFFKMFFLILINILNF